MYCFGFCFKRDLSWFDSSKIVLFFHFLELIIELSFAWKILSVTIYCWSYPIKLKVWCARPLLGVFCIHSFLSQLGVRTIIFSIYSYFLFSYVFLKKGKKYNRFPMWKSTLLFFLKTLEILPTENIRTVMWKTCAWKNRVYPTRSYSLPGALWYTNWI